jgi:hypothetical protein
VAATAIFFLTGCLESAVVLSQLQTDVKTASADSLPQRDSSAQPRISIASNPIQIGPDEPFFQFFPDDYWSAVADLDIEGAREIAATGAERRFAEGFAMLSAGNLEKAEDIFTELSAETSDLTVAVTAKNMLATALLYEHKWDRLRSLRDEWKLLDRDQENIAALAWGSAFAGAPPSETFFPDKPVVMPFRLTAVGTPIIRVGINGKHYDFWLDTGSSITVLSSSVADDANVGALGHDTLLVGTFAGAASVKPALLDHLEIGKMVIANSPAIIMDAALMKVQGGSDALASPGLAVDGIIGWDVIRHLDVSMDYHNGVVIFRIPRDLRTRGTSAQNLTWAGKPFVSVRAKYAGTMHFTLDTGAQSSFIDSSAIAKLRLTAVSTSTRAYGIGKSGGNTVRVVRQAKLTVAGRSLVMRDVIVNDQPPTGLINSDGILGSDVGQYGTIRIDATNGIFSIGVD